MNECGPRQLVVAFERPVSSSGRLLSDDVVPTCDIFLFIHHLAGGDDLRHDDEQVPRDEAVGTLGAGCRLVDGIRKTDHHQTQCNACWEREIAYFVIVLS